MFQGVKTWFMKNETEVMLTMGLVGMVTSMIMTVKSSMKSKDVLDKKKIAEDRVKLGVKDTIKTAGKYYIAPVILFGASTASIIASYKVNTTRNTILASALATSQAALTEYQKHVINEVGQETDNAIRKKIAESHVDERLNSVEPNLILPIGNDNKVTCVEATTNYVFRCDKESIRKVVNDLNETRLNFCGQVTLNDFYYGIGIPQTPLGDMMGWGYDERVNVEITAIEHDGIPCLYIKPVDYTVM